MERLLVDNFLNLKHIELDVAKINIIIGRQAQGKSVLAKLVYFFRQFITNFHECIFPLDNSINNKVEEINIIILNLFKKIFPEYSWKNQEFEIKYYFSGSKFHFSENQMFVYLKKNKKFSDDLSLLYSDNLSVILDNWIKLIDNFTVNKFDIFTKNTKLKLSDSEYISILEQLQEMENNRMGDIMTQRILKYMKRNNSAYLLMEILDFKKNIFIPSVRSFFMSYILKNVFSFLSQDIDIDYFSKGLGVTYEQAKNNYLAVKLERNKELLQINEITNNIIHGNYLQESDQDWIIHQDNRKVRLSDASSGQQEALPITLILSVLPFLKDAQSYHFFIEEPEAHLFPDAQKYMVELFSLVFNLTEKKNGFFITTHSPYILTAFNNLIQAGNARKKIAERGNKPEELKKLYSIVSEDKILDIEDLGVYTLENGKLKSIIEEENRLIDENIIDEISDEIGSIFDKLVDLELGEE